MAYLRHNKEKNTIFIYEERTQRMIESNLGELLFSFLDLDLSQYNDLYKLCGLGDTLDCSTIDCLKIQYPKTTKRINYYSLDSFDDTKDLCLYYLLENDDEFLDMYKHPYFSCSDTVLDGALGSFKIDYYDADFYEYQKNMKELIRFCFLENERTDINSLTPNERYYLFTTMKHERFKYIPHIHSTMIFTPMALYNEMCHRNILYSKTTDDIGLDKISPDCINKLKGVARPIKVNECKTIQDFMFFEFDCLLSQNITIKRCANCGKLFIPCGKYNTDCCDRIPEGEKYSCKKIMAQRRRKEKLKSNPIIFEYERAYKRNYARLSNHKLNNESFRLWVDDASQKRDEISEKYEQTPSEELLSDFKKYLGNK